jgi:undecaprenyl-diphosphatase
MLQETPLGKPAFREDSGKDFEREMRRDRGRRIPRGDRARRRKGTMEQLVRLDTLLFNFLNHAFHTPFLDTIMLYVTKVKHWRIPIGLLWVYLLIWGGRKGRTVALLMIPAIGIADFLNDDYLKLIFLRDRPCHVLQDVHLLVYCSRSPSLPSSHALNTFTAATLFSLFYRWQIGLICFLVAAVVGYSRVYVGAHYPFDVLAGALLGILWATLLVWVWRWVEGRIPWLRKTHGTPPSGD